MKTKMPQLGEAIFSIVYLIFGFCAGFYMLAVSNGDKLSILYALTTLVLAGGDSFHLVPRIINALSDKFNKYEFWAGLGLMISSITMTIYYLLLLETCKMSANGSGNPLNNIVVYCIWTFAIIRIVLCLFPQNNWLKKEGNQKWGIIRNIPFAVVGVLMIYVCLILGYIALAVAICISFLCYFPVVLWAKKKPMIGMLMIPKTIAYMWMIGIFLNFIF